jgi:hypothetical protein
MSGVIGLGTIVALGVVGQQTLMTDVSALYSTAVVTMVAAFFVEEWRHGRASARQ